MSIVINNINIFAINVIKDDVPFRMSCLMGQCSIGDLLSSYEIREIFYKRKFCMRFPW